MAFHGVIEVINGDPIQTIRDFLRIPLEKKLLDAFFLPVWLEETQRPIPALITSPEELANADPFAPVMFCNSGSVAFQEVEQNPSLRIGIILRPCELRTFLFLAAESEIHVEDSILISMDCLATFPVDDFGWRLEKAQERDLLSKTALHFAAQGGLLPSRYRGSCQLCDEPYPESANLQFELFGIETSKNIVIRSDTEETLKSLGMESILAKSVTQEMTNRRQHTIDRLLEWRIQSQDYASAHLTQEQKTIDGLIRHLMECIACQNTVSQHCPSFDLNWVVSVDVIDDEVFKKWLTNCGGCGMCEHSCPEDFPIFKSISFVSRSLRSSG